MDNRDDTDDRDDDEVNFDEEPKDAQEGAMDNSDDTDNTDDEVVGDDNETEGAEEEFMDDEEATEYEQQIPSMEFQTLEDAEKFYDSYAKAKGFSVRRRDLRRNRRGVAIGRTMVCSREGTRDKMHIDKEGRTRQHRKMTRHYCKASYTVRFDRNKKMWVVSKFERKHSHRCCNEEESQFLRSHRNVSEGDKALAIGMRQSGIKQRNIVQFMKNKVGGYENPGYTPKDLDNAVQQSRTVDDDLIGDVNRTLGYLQSKHTSDAGSFFKYTTNVEGELGNLFWSDSTSRADYHFFGDVLAFDACYKRNRYNRPFVMMVGVNHHHRNIIYGFAQLDNETIPNYVWLLNTFLECMNSKMPTSVITDGDKSMRGAIATVLVGVPHRLCIWHIETNATTAVHNKEFVSAFTYLVKARISIEEFERRWEHLISQHGLSANKWLQDLYADKLLWAEAYLKDMYFGGLQSTSRCESCNHWINGYVGTQYSLQRFVQGIDEALEGMRFTEVQDDYTSRHTRLVCKHALRTWEMQAESIYTHHTFAIFKSELENEASYVLAERRTESDGTETFILKNYMNPDRIRRLTFTTSNQDLKCECALFESKGFPCRHMLTVIKNMGYTALPSSWFKLRWTQNAKTLNRHPGVGGDVGEKVGRLIRHGGLALKCKRLCDIACGSESAFNHVSKTLDDLTQWAIEFARERTDNTTPANPPTPLRSVKDPKIGKTKGTFKSA
ncbi:unnamed protein product [Linum trigynum]|uniref:SWIM-type domain-containing protein n=1 Tax=Linum trigynum TaxID=586398 RepID=A0AAV2FX88_9ROSI